MVESLSRSPTCWRASEYITESAKSWKMPQVNASSASAESKCAAYCLAATALHSEADQNIFDSVGSSCKSLCSPVRQYEIASVRIIPSPSRFTATCGLVTRLRTPNHDEFASARILVESEASELMTLAYSDGSASGFFPSSMNFMATAAVVGR